jgi:hypothetical protein
MVCGTTSAGVGLVTILVPALVVPFVLANVIGWTIFGVHKHRKHKRQREGRSGGDGSAAGAVVLVGLAVLGELQVQPQVPLTRWVECLFRDRKWFRQQAALQERQ